MSVDTPGTILLLHTPILHFSVTYLQINQLVEFPADPALSIRIGRPSHTLARLYQLSYSFRYFRPYSIPPFNPKYTKFKKCCEALRHFNRFVESGTVTILYYIQKKNVEKMNHRYTIVQVKLHNNIKSADSAWITIFLLCIYFSPYFPIIQKKIIKK